MHPSTAPLPSSLLSLLSISITSCCANKLTSATLRFKHYDEYFPINWNIQTSILSIQKGIKPECPQSRASSTAFESKCPQTTKPKCPWTRVYSIQTVLKLAHRSKRTSSKKGIFTPTNPQTKVTFNLNVLKVAPPPPGRASSNQHFLTRTSSKAYLILSILSAGCPLNWVSSSLTVFKPARPQNKVFSDSHLLKTKHVQISTS